MAKLSRFRDDAARQRFLIAYDNALAAWPVPPTQRDIDTRYGTTHVHSCGSRDGAPIILLHAVAVSSPSWFASVAVLGADHPVHAIDTIADAGRSTQTAPIRDAADMARWLDDVLEGLDVDAAHLIGLSYGGWLALNQARRSPDRLASVVAVDPPGAIGRARVTFMLKLVPDGLLAKFARSDKALHRLLQALNNGQLPTQPLLDLSVCGLRSFHVKQPFPKRMSDDDLRSIRIPTLLLFGEQSPVNHARQAAARARRLVANVEAEVVPNAGHALPMEDPELFARRVLRFIEAGAPTHDEEEP